MGRPHGLRGAFFVSGRDEPIPKAYGELRIGLEPEAAKLATIRASHMQGERPLLACTLATDRTGAEALTGQWIYVERLRVDKETRTDEALWVDLEGSDVVDQAGTRLGRVHHVYNAGASDVVAVTGADGRTLDVPLVGDYVDLARPLDADGQLRLLVGAETFEELWETPRLRGGGKPDPGDSGDGDA